MIFFGLLIGISILGYLLILVVFYIMDYEYFHGTTLGNLVSKVHYGTEPICYFPVINLITGLVALAILIIALIVKVIRRGHKYLISKCFRYKNTPSITTLLGKFLDSISNIKI